MDPITIDPIKALASITGIVALTIALVHVIKRDLGDKPYFRHVPAWIYAAIVSIALTYLSHSILHTIEGELPALLTQAVLQVIVASGVIDWWKNKSKPIEETS